MLGEIQALNTAATDCMRYGDHESALPILQHAISQLSECMLAPTPIPSPQEDQALPASGFSTSEYKDRQAPHGISIYYLEEPQYEDEEEQTQKILFASNDIVRRAIMFECKNESLEESGMVTEEQYQTCAVTCLYNLGLCYQLEWASRISQQRVGQGTDQLLCHAHELYHQAFSLLQHAQLKSCDPILHVLMTICVNAAFGQSQMGDVHSLRIWNDRLLIAMRYIDGLQEEDVPHCSSFQRVAFLNNYGGSAAQAA